MYAEAKKVTWNERVPGLDRDDVMQELVIAGLKAAEKFDGTLSENREEGLKLFSFWVRRAMQYKLRRLYRDQNMISRRASWSVTEVPEGGYWDNYPSLEEWLEEAYDQHLTPNEKISLRLWIEHRGDPDDTHIITSGLKPGQYKKSVLAAKDKMGLLVSHEYSDQDIDKGGQYQQDVEDALDGIPFSEEERRLIDWALASSGKGQSSSKRAMARDLGISQVRTHRLLWSLRSNRELRELLEVA
jgi:hypothetical protein